MAFDGASGFGKNGKPELWFGKGRLKQSPIHVAFTADSRKQLEQFYEAALASGAFVIDTDKYNIETVRRSTE
ncbi:hypothetical protein ACRRS0_16770 [Agarivorans sp. QJM3NY_29]|uniref:hypothetical protein n=1 Tax=unclassified Agarivorans TaxID=2636026 RepID=UPI003D7E7603